MFFYLCCGRGFNCLHGRWMKRCLISYFLCGNPQNNFGPHKARKNLGLEAVKWKTVAKVGVAPLRPTCLQMRNISPRRCPNPLLFLVFDSETADEPVSHAKPHVALRNCNASTGWNSTTSTERSRNFCKVLGGNVSFSYLRTVTQLLVITWYGYKITGLNFFRFPVNLATVSGVWYWLVRSFHSRLQFQGRAANILAVAFARSGSCSCSPSESC